ncbi:hypothetical protein ASNO1_17110 [Corallococcus caeni]|uniref:Flippase-like domain-containing protein n=1 Tax=Corallococcus caeni TaxID=3082388 RepID=A0ABQ6QQ58_9BACT|nr:hypothetical protein ASNO1_17110 [Corallococcus sp. NO1]
MWRRRSLRTGPVPSASPEPEGLLADAPARRGWGFGLALLAALILMVARASDEREFARLLKQSAPTWLFVAVLLQAATYLSQSAVWRAVLRRTRFHVPLGALYTMSFAKLFVDQALPSAGISGAALSATVLFRGFSFYLPLLPGLWLSRGVLRE